MAMQHWAKKPIMVGGLGLCLLLGSWEYLTGEWQEINQWLLWGLSGLGVVVWRLRRSPPVVPQPREPLTPAALETAIAKGAQYLHRLQSQTPGLDLADLQAQLTALTVAPALPSVLNGVILGEKRTGKSSLLALLPSQGYLVGSSAPLPLNWQAVPAETPLSDLESLISPAHFVWVLTHGDLTASQWQVLEWLRANHHHWQLLFNKQDLYSDGDRQAILAQLQHQITALEPDQPVQALSVAPQAVQIRRHLADGQIEYDQEAVPPHLGNLLSQLGAIEPSRCQAWQRGVDWRRAQTLQHQGRQRWQDNRRALALPLIEQAQWLTAGAALINPVANLDLLAAIAINGQLVWDLGQLYGQKMSLAQGKTVARQMGEIVIKLGMVELSTQALAGLLKSQPLTYGVGGSLQALSAAYLTHIAGLSLVTFLENQAPDQAISHWDWQRFTAVVEQTFAQNQRLSVLQGFWQTARKQLPTFAPPTVPAQA